MVHKIKFELLPHKSYIPDLSPCDNRLSGPLMKASVDIDFQDMQEVVHILLQSKTIFSDGIKKSVGQHNSVQRMG
jgi:hypothetical protein